MNRPYLEIILPDGRAERVAITAESLVIGRSKEADIRIAQPQVSHRHVKLKRTKQGRWLIQDLGARNRTFLKGQAIVAHLLSEADVLFLGDIKIIFHDPTGESDELSDYTIYREEDVSGQTWAGCDLPEISVDESALAVPANASGYGRRGGVEPMMYAPPTSGLAMEEPLMEGMADGDGEGENPLNLATLKKILRYKKTIAVTFLAIAVPALIGVWTLLNPNYTAAAKIRVRPIIPRLVFNTDDNGTIPLYDSYKNTQASIILSPKVLQRVLDRSEIQQTTWYKDPGGLSRKQGLPLERLARTMEVRPERATEVIDVNMTYQNAGEATVIVNAVLEEYLKFTRENSSETSDFLYNKLTEELDSLGKEIEVLERITARLRKELGTGNPEELVAQKRVRLDETQAKLDELDQEIDVIEWQIRELEKQFGVAAGESPSSQGLGTRYGADQEWRRLNYDVNQATKKLEMARQRLGDRHRTVADLGDQVKLAREMLTVRESQLDQQMGLPSEAMTAQTSSEGEQTLDLESSKHKVALFKYRRKILTENFQKQKTDFDQTFSNAQMLTRENENIDHKRELYDKVRAALDQREMEGKVPGAIEIIARAVQPTTPSKDRRTSLTAATLFGAIFAGFALAFVRTKLNPVIQEAGELSNRVRTPFLGQLPILAEPETGEAESSLRNEAIRMVRTSLLYRLDGRHGNTIVITSATQGAGKTTLTLSLAQSLAQCGKKVLLVDGDLRNPNIASRLGRKDGAGLLTILNGKATDDEVISATDTPGLDFLSAGAGRNGEGHEYIANGQFSACLDRWRKTYDLVLLDSSPVLPVADARILSRQADGTVFVVREGHCQREDVVEALACLGASGGKLLGIVYSGAHHRGSYNHYYGGYPYGYGSDRPATGQEG
jgi:capsular exopolysaccharide synthesis family protein